MRTSLQKHKKILFFLLIILLFGIISGILFYLKQEESIKKTIALNMADIFNHNIFSGKNIFIHMGIALIIIAASFLFLGIPAIIIAIFFEGISIGFIIPLFLSIFSWKFIYIFPLYFLFIKLLYLILLSILFLKDIDFTKNYISYLKKKSSSLAYSLKKLFSITLFILINDIFIYFGLNKILIFLLG